MKRSNDQMHRWHPTKYYIQPKYKPSTKWATSKEEERNFPISQK